MDWTLVKQFTGVSLAWGNANGLCKIDYRGYANKMSGRTVTENTLFPACSITKYVTAICVIKLKSSGILDLYADVNQYLRDWKIRDLEGEEKKVTLIDLLSHTAGIIDGEDGFYGHRIGDKNISIIDILEGRTTYNPRAARVEKKPGTFFEYSDAGYCIIQKIIEDITGKTYDKVIDELIFKPLGMEKSFIGTEENIKCHQKDMATGYNLSGEAIERGIPLCPDMAASSLWSTPSDILLLATDFYTNLNNGYGQEMLNGPKDMNWVGLGLFMDEKHIVSKGWGENGQCMLKINIDSGAMGVVMTNMNPEVPQEESGLERLLDSLL